MEFTLELGVSAIIAVIGAYVAVKVALAKCEEKISSLRDKCRENESDLSNYKPLIQQNVTAIKQRDVEMQEVHRRLNAIDKLDLGARLASIETDLKYITSMLESMKGGRRDGER
jgi:chromosome segregation ATPase